MEEDIKKFVERAADLLANFTKKEKKTLKPVAEAAKEFKEASSKIPPGLEVKFQVGSVDVLYNYIKSKYPDEASSLKADKMLELLKGIAENADEHSGAKADFIYKQLIEELKIIETKIQAKYPNYRKRFE